MSWRRISGAFLVITGASAAAGIIIVGFAILARYLKLPDAAETLGASSSTTVPVLLTVGAMLLTGRILFGRWDDRTEVVNAVAFGIRTAGTFVAMALGGVLIDDHCLTSDPDIYAIGACIYACMQGFPPNEAPQRQEKDRLSLALAKLRGVYSDNLIEVVEWCMALDPLSRPQSVFALQKELSREGERRYTKLSVGEKMRLQLDTLVSDTKKNVQKVGDATGIGAKPK